MQSAAAKAFRRSSTQSDSGSQAFTFARMRLHATGVSTEASHGVNTAMMASRSARTPDGVVHPEGVGHSVTTR